MPWRRGVGFCTHVFSSPEDLSKHQTEAHGVPLPEKNAFLKPTPSSERSVPDSVGSVHRAQTELPFSVVQGQAAVRENPALLEQLLMEEARELPQPCDEC
jgi:hypothetical protein